ncbi:hypothetical protein, partial [Enterococcus faecalis]|uniref:hypothetical protein n=1 Tax=Enterococcus faecalis TaxID=1351 RepID=UPI003D6B760D
GYDPTCAKDVAKLFPEQAVQIRQFVKQNRLSFKKSERERSLVKVVGQLKIDNGQWRMENGELASALDNGQWIMDNGKLEEDAA